MTPTRSGCGKCRKRSRGRCDYRTRPQGGPSRPAVFLALHAVRFRHLLARYLAQWRHQDHDLHALSHHAAVAGRPALLHIRDGGNIWRGGALQFRAALHLVAGKALPGKELHHHAVKAVGPSVKTVKPFFSVTLSADSSFSASG